MQCCLINLSRKISKIENPTYKKIYFHITHLIVILKFIGDKYSKKAEFSNFNPK